MDFRDSVMSYVPEGLQRYVGEHEYPEPADLGTPPESWLISAAALGAGVLTRKALMQAWGRFRGSKPPENPAGPGVTWTDALIWAVATGATIGVARVISRRMASAAVRNRGR